MPSTVIERVSELSIGLKSLQPWVQDKKLRARLEEAGWRYAVLIGVVDADQICLPKSIQMEDLSKYRHLIHKWEGWPLWDDNEATTFVSEITGASRSISAAWLDLDWNDGGED